MMTSYIVTELFVIFMSLLLLIGNIDISVIIVEIIGKMR